MPVRPFCPKLVCPAAFVKSTLFHEIYLSFGIKPWVSCQVQACQTTADLEGVVANARLAKFQQYIIHCHDMGLIHDLSYLTLIYY